jgi:iron complex outermembrane receptor protein
MTTYHLAKEHQIFLGAGYAMRVPDARELYFKKGANTVGTPNLKQTKNTEIDLGYTISSENLEFKIKGFYSMLKDYIYIKKGTAANAFYNIDATVYGGEMSASYYLNDDISMDAGLSYKRGKKDQALPGQTNTNLADIAPLRGNVALNYDYMNNATITLEMQASKRWDKIDSDNGEQVLAGWAIANAKIKHAVNKQFDLTIGMNNIFDVTYAQSNTYADLTLITTGGGDTILLNEPGRYFYTNLDFKF